MFLFFFFFFSFFWGLFFFFARKLIFFFFLFSSLSFFSFLPPLSLSLSLSLSVPKRGANRNCQFLARRTGETKKSWRTGTNLGEIGFSSWTNFASRSLSFLSLFGFLLFLFLSLPFSLSLSFSLFLFFFL